MCPYLREGSGQPEHVPQLNNTTSNQGLDSIPLLSTLRLYSDRSLNVELARLSSVEELRID